MVTDSGILNVATHYHKIAHIKFIEFSIYSSSTNSDQALLQLELNIRYNNPNILITYYNKSLYYFRIEDEKPIEFADDDCLELKSTQKVSVENLSNSPKGNNGDEMLAFASISFLKAVKKHILFNLSRNHIVRLFGNYSVVNLNGINSLLYLDPVLLQNGDLLISTAIRKRLELYDSSALNLSPDSNFVIYLIPSGIRCHLFDNDNFSKNFVKKSKVDDLIKLIQLCTGLDYSSEDMLWVKLTPNLKHLNNQTSRISKFIHLVENKKFILWPWDLCLLQFGNYEESVSDLMANQSEDQNPLELISDFIDFNISNNSNLPTSSHQHTMSLSSVGSTGLSSAPHSIGHKETMSMMSTLESGQAAGDVFDAPNSDLTGYFINKTPDGNPKNDEEQPKQGEQNSFPELGDENQNDDSQSKDDDMEIDDLFGDGSDLDDSSQEAVPEEENILSDKPSETFNVDSKLEKSIGDGYVDGIENTREYSPNKDSEEQTQPKKEQDDEEAEEDEDKLGDLLLGDFLRKKELKDSITTFIDIPKDQMTVKKNPTPMYNDPGAPLPIAQTPVIPQTMSTSVNSSNPPSSSAAPEDQGKSVFSPILFNPIIKSNIDSKYGKGGKFYVEKELSIDPDKKKQLRATSVSGYDPPSRDIDTTRNFSSSDSSEESDEDETSMPNSPPLKLNTLNESFINQPNSFQLNNTIVERQNLGFSSLNTGGFASPMSNMVAKFPTQKADSPFIANEPNNSYASIEYEQQSSSQIPLSINSEPEGSGKSSTESSNYLPLILRSINVSTIPTFFLLNNLVDTSLIPNFNIHDVDVEGDFDSSKNHEMLLKFNNVSESIKFLSSHIIFDLGLNNFKKNIKSVNNTESSTSLVDYEKADYIFESSFTKLFPYSYKVDLKEFLNGMRTEPNNELKDQLNFLGQISEDTSDRNTKVKRLNNIEWNSFNLTTRNNENFEEYSTLMKEIVESLAIEDETFFRLPASKIRVHKNDAIINLSSTGVNFWKYLNFSPLHGRKNFQVLLISENGSFNTEFLNSLIYNYRDCNFGDISKVNLKTSDTRPDLESINDGLLLFNKENEQSYNSFYKQVNVRLTSLVELIKLALINKTSGFEFDRPFLLLFLNFNENLNSLLKIASIFKNFENALKDHQLPLVQMFTKVLPGAFFVKRINNQSHLRILSTINTSKISMNLYNQCPNDLEKRSYSNTTFTKLVRDKPNAIPFRSFNKNSKENENSSNDDIFLHLAYERSIDKSWISAAWSDPHGNVTFTKSWCSTFDKRNGGKGPNELESITDEMWSISIEIFKRLSDEAVNKPSGFGGRRFLILTRINSIIPDDELIHWKRLSLKQNDVSLVVLSVNQSPKLVFSKLSSPKANESNTHLQPQQQRPQDLSNDRLLDFPSFRNYSVNSSPAAVGMMTSPANSFQSPQQFLNVPGIFLSPQDIATNGAMNSNGTNIDSNLTICDPRREIFAAVPEVPLPSFNSPTRLGMKIGYLLKELETNDYLVFEVSLLSCSSFWNTRLLMKIILNHYKKLIVLNDILGLRDIDAEVSNEDPSSDKFKKIEISSTIPWHIAAVTKSLDYLVHVNVED
ncbi:uncharacterized protein PRCAT00004076001 [Priceomyces carsonii]|uniref:uncharacterized protein n=1 Tax=Priceomyces carsonii TaxID=28549 RepID=UPI002ED81C6A|nr:unnamed protein product [Priceomyces carsonii]